MKEKRNNVAIDTMYIYFEKSFLLNAPEKEFLRKNFHSRLFKKRQYILREGSTCADFNFVVKGCLRSYKIDQKGNIHILQFATENNWINDLGSFQSSKPSALFIDALEDTIVLQISRDNLIALYETYPKFERVFRILIENAYILLQERLMQNISSSADERYLSFIESYPQLQNRLSQIQIAAFLGIIPEFLSRLRNHKKNLMC